LATINGLIDLELADRLPPTPTSPPPVSARSLEPPESHVKAAYRDRITGARAVASANVIQRRERFALGFWFVAILRSAGSGFTLRVSTGLRVEV
jgi:hypothetical protein